MKDINKELEEIRKMNKQTRRNNTVALVLSGVALGLTLSRLINMVLEFIFSK